jgi:hypothetical protein
MELPLCLRCTALPPTRTYPHMDESMIVNLGSEIDRYYGTNSATSDVQLLWNASSLAHGERWYSTLTAGPRRAVAEILTSAIIRCRMQRAQRHWSTDSHARGCAQPELS